MIRYKFILIGFAPLLLLSGSQKQPVPLAPVPNAAIDIKARVVMNTIVATRSPFHFVKAWTLSSANRDFGSVSAMMRDSSGFTTISDHGAITRFKMSADSEIFNASIAPLPRGCAADELKTSRDAESLSRNPRTGEVLIGFEWSNSICRSEASLTKALKRTAPQAMRAWPILAGAEALVTLRGGATIVFAEQSSVAGETSPMLIFDGDPTSASTRVSKASYRPPAGYKPTDAAQLPDGRLVIVNRRYEFPLRFSAVITIANLEGLRRGGTLSGEIVARLDDQSIAENYEAIAVSQKGERTFVWVMSDDNFIALQSTKLLMFEMVSTNPTKPRA